MAAEKEKSVFMVDSCEDILCERIRELSGVIGLYSCGDTIDAETIRKIKRWNKEIGYHLFTLEHLIEEA